MAKGLRFFGTDYNSSVFDPTYDASSATNKDHFAFDGLKATRWTSDGENTDGDEVYLEVDYGFNRTIDSLFIYSTNIEDVEVRYWTGSAWATVNAAIATVTKSADLFHYFAILDSAITTQILRIVGKDTITVNQEKYVTLFHAFQQLGQFEYFPNFKPKFSTFQHTFRTTDGRSYVIERGEIFECTLDFKSHINQDDIDLVETLLERKEPFYLWPNGGDEDIFTYSFRPFRFQDIFKVAIVGSNSPGYTKNYYKAGYNNKISMIEVV